MKLYLIGMLEMSEKHNKIKIEEHRVKVGNREAGGVTTVPRSYAPRSTFRTCPSFSSMTSLTFYDLLPLTHANDFTC